MEAIVAQVEGNKYTVSNLDSGLDRYFLISATAQGRKSDLSIDTPEI
ncbi:MAG: hypothetical protein ACKN89_00050 [Cyanobium sp.]